MSKAIDPKDFPVGTEGTVGVGPRGGKGPEDVGMRVVVVGYCSGNEMLVLRYLDQDLSKIKSYVYRLSKADFVSNYPSATWGPGNHPDTAFYRPLLPEWFVRATAPVRPTVTPAGKEPVRFPHTCTRCQGPAFQMLQLNECINPKCSSYVPGARGAL